MINNLVEYVSDAIRFATQETGLKDWDGFIILVNEFELEGKETITGIPVYVLPMKASGGYFFSMAYPWDIDSQREKALKAVLEYQDLYKLRC